MELTTQQLQQDHAVAQDRIEDDASFGPKYDARIARAFNAGADARLKGLPISSSSGPHVKEMVAHWVAGWKHADKYWGKDAARWPYRTLPPVQRVA